MTGSGIAYYFKFIRFGWDIVLGRLFKLIVSFLNSVQSISEQYYWLWYFWLWYFGPYIIFFISCFCLKYFTPNVIFVSWPVLHISKIISRFWNLIAIFVEDQSRTFVLYLLMCKLIITIDHMSKFVVLLFTNVLSYILQSAVHEYISGWKKQSKKTIYFFLE